MVSLVAGSYEPVCQMPPPPVFHALFLSFHVSLPGSPGFGIAYQRQSSLPVLASSAAIQPRVLPSPAPLAMMTLPSAVIGAVKNLSRLPNSLVAAIILSQTISPLSRLIGDHAAVGQVGDDQVFPERDAARARHVALVLHAGIGDPDELALVFGSRASIL